MSLRETVSGLVPSLGGPQTCPICGDPIETGQDTAELDGKTVHRSCVRGWQAVTRAAQGNRGGQR